MRIIWNIRHSLSRMLYAIAERLPSAWTRKITILLCALRRDWRAIRLLSDFSGELESVSAAEIDRHFQGLDENSLFLLKRYIGKSHFIPWFHWVTAQTPRHYHVWAGLCTEEEFSRGKRGA